jgi:hypothetical protein
MTTVGQCDKNVHDQTNNPNETTPNGNTNVFTHWWTFVTTTSKTIVAEVVRALATQDRGIGVGGVALCGAVATFAVGQINLFGVVQKILAHQGGVGSTQTSRWKSTRFKGSIVVVAPRPTKFGYNARPSNITNARSSNGAYNAPPLFCMGRGTVQVFEFIAIGGFFKPKVLARTFSRHVVVVPRWTRLARRPWYCVLILKSTLFALLANGAIFVAELSFAARLAFGGSFGTGFARRAIFTELIGRRTAFGSGRARRKTGESIGINFRSLWHGDRGRSSFGHD